MSNLNQKKIQQLYGFLFGFVIILLIGLITFIVFDVRIKKIPLSEQVWYSEPGLVAVENINMDNPNLIFYRLLDAKAETLPGVFNYYFVNNHETIVYGFMNEEPITQYFFVITDFGGFIKNISALPGRITGIKQNRRGSHLLIEGLRSVASSSTAQSFYTCLTEKNTSDIITCDFIPETILKDTFEKSNTYYATWQDNHETLIAIQELGSKQRKFYYDALTQELMETEPMASSSPKTVEQTSPKNINTKRLSFVTFLFDQNNYKLHVLWINDEDSLKWVDQEHVLINRNKKSYVYNITTREMSEFTEIPPPELRIINVASLRDQ